MVNIYVHIYMYICMCAYHVFVHVPLERKSLDPIIERNPMVHTYIHCCTHTTRRQSRPSDFPNFRFTFEQIPFDIQMVYFYWFLATFTPKLCLHIYIYSCFIVMWLFSSILVPGELFLIHFQKYVLTGSSVSNHKFHFGFRLKRKFSDSKSLTLHLSQ